MCGETAALTTIRGGLRCPSAQLKTLKRIYRTRELSPGNLSLIADSNAGTQCDPPSNNQNELTDLVALQIFARLAYVADGPRVSCPASSPSGRTPNSEELGVLGIRVGALAP